MITTTCIACGGYEEAGIGSYHWYRYCGCCNTSYWQAERGGKMVLVGYWTADRGDVKIPEGYLLVLNHEKIST